MTAIRTLPNYRTPTEVHHIVAQAAINAKPARDIINKVLSPQGVQHPNNLIAIKTGVHRRLHTNVYYNLVNNIIQKAYNKASGNLLKQKQYVNQALFVLRSYVKTISDLAPF